MILLYTKLFNLILTTGKTQQSWSIGVIKPLFKSKEMYLTLTTIEELPSLVTLGSYSPM